MRTEDDGPQIASEVIESTLQDEVERGYAEYAVYTIHDRALPDVRDGLKPVQRRILYSMHQSGLTSTKSHTKSARVVGDVMGKYHPHGDAAIYDAMVRMAQPFTFFTPPIDGQGNFGIPGEGAAAPRYTESRLSVFGELMVSELRDNVVPMIPNFDDKLTQPEVLPTQIPTLLINGQTGIAVAMATNMAPHNPREAINAVLYQLRNQGEWDAIKSAESDEERQAATARLVKNLMKKMPGPDFPTGAKIIGVEGAQAAYETGSGRVIIQSRYQIEPMPRGQHKITFFEIPYDASPSGIIDHLKRNEEAFIKSRRILKENGGKGKIEGFQIEGVVSIDDFSDRNNPTRIVVVTDSRTNPEVVVAELFQRTKLQSSFSFNTNCLVRGVPKVVTLPELIQHFIAFRKGITKERATNEKASRSDRLHLVRGMQKVLPDIDAAIAIIRSSESPADAEAALMKKFEIDSIQAKHILAVPLGRLTKYDNIELSNEADTLVARLAELDEIIANPTEVLDAELSAILAAFKKDERTARRSEIVGGSLAEIVEEQKSALTMSREIADEPVTLYLSADGKVTREPGRGFLCSLSTTTLGTVYVLTSHGRGLRVPVTDIAGAGDIRRLEPGEKVVSVVSGERNVVIGTKRGVVFAFTPSFPSRYDEFPIIALADDDEVLGGAECDEADELVFISSDSSLLRYGADKVAVKQTLNGKGMAGMKVSEGEQVIFFGVVKSEHCADADVVTVTDMSAKSTPLHEYPQKGRATGGVRSHKFLKGESSLSVAAAGANLMLLDGSSKRLSPSRLVGKRDASGHRLGDITIAAVVQTSTPSGTSEN